MRDFCKRGALRSPGGLCRDRAPATHLLGAPPQAPGRFCGTGSPCTHRCRRSALHPGDFLMRRKSPKTHQEPPGSWTSGTRGRTPLDSPGFCPSGIGGVGTGSAASSQGWRGSGANRGPIRDRSYWGGAQTAQTAHSFPNSLSLYPLYKYLL